MNAMTETHAAPFTGQTAARFTVDGDEELELHLERACQRVLSGVRGLIPPDRLEAVLLGGGYGRGEGGVLREGGGHRPYNDLEFYIFVQGNRHLNELRYRRPLMVLGEILSHLADVEIEFKITSLAELQALPVSMFSYDLLAGHRLLWSVQPLPASFKHHLAADRIPFVEATRLLMNRGTGLLLARAKLDGGSLSPEDADFVNRNIAKAQLACGDAVLTMHGRYHWSCGERHLRLTQLAELNPEPWYDDLLRHHATGAAFKLHPTPRPPARHLLLAHHAEVSALMRHCWLWCERRRLGRTFATVRDYASDPVDKLPGTSGLRNSLQNLRMNGFKPQLQPRPWRHPRQRVFRALPLLLWDDRGKALEDARAQLRRELRSKASSPAEFLRDYLAIWRCVQ